MPITSGATITLAPSADTLSDFIGWSGGGCAGTAPCTLSISMDTKVMAQFTSKQTILTVSLTGTGHGSVHSTPAGIACTSGSSAGCSAEFTGDVILIPTASVDSLFAGWSEACTNLAGNCTVTMDRSKSVSAEFNTNPLVRIVVGQTISYFGLMDDAYNCAANGNTLEARDVVFTENLIFDRPISVFVKGGFDSAYMINSGKTKLRGTLIIKQGSVRIENLIVY